MSWQSRFEAIRSNKIFEFFIMSIIMVSALMVGAKTYELSPAAFQTMIILDWMITAIFVTEITIRYLADPNLKRFLSNGWNIFDTLIVAISLIPIDNTDTALVARLVRVFRVLRMISIIPELRVLLNSLIKALPRLGYVMGLMFIIFYIYAAAGSLFFAPINSELWGDISISMLTLFRVMTMEDWTDVMYETMTVYPLSWAYYITFIFLTAFAFLNMVIGIVVNVLEEEHKKMNEEENQEVTMETLHKEILYLRQLIEQKNVTDQLR